MPSFFPPDRARSARINAALLALALMSSAGIAQDRPAAGSTRIGRIEEPAGLVQARGPDNARVTFTVP